MMMINLGFETSRHTNVYINEYIYIYTHIHIYVNRERYCAYIHAESFFLHILVRTDRCVYVYCILLCIFSSCTPHEKLSLGIRRTIYYSFIFGNTEMEKLRARQCKCQLDEFWNVHTTVDVQNSLLCGWKGVKQLYDWFTTSLSCSRSLGILLLLASF